MNRSVVKVYFTAEDRIECATNTPQNHKLSGMLAVNSAYEVPINSV